MLDLAAPRKVLSPVRSDRGGQDRPPKRTIILEFESMERVRQWWASDEYGTLKALRRSASVGNIMLVEGLSPADS